MPQLLGTRDRTSEGQHEKENLHCDCTSAPMDPRGDQSREIGALRPTGEDLPRTPISTGFPARGSPGQTDLDSTVGTPREPWWTLPFIGRREELKRLYDGLVRADAGNGSSWLVIGAPGVGKTRLLRRLADLGEARGFSVRWSQGLRSLSTPLFPFLQLLGTPATPEDGAVGHSTLETIHGSRFTASLRGLPSGGIARVTMETGQGTLRGSHRNHGQTTHAVDLTILELLRNLERQSQDQPLLLVLDDLQWAYPESFRAFKLISNAARTLRIVVIGVLRDDLWAQWETSDPRTSELLDARRSGAIEWLDLRPLSPDDSSRLVLSVLGESRLKSVRQGEIMGLASRCGGNPYFIIESVRTAVEGGYLVRTRHGWSSPVPTGPAAEGPSPTMPVPSPFDVCWPSGFEGSTTRISAFWLLLPGSAWSSRPIPLRLPLAIPRRPYYGDCFDWHALAGPYTSRIASSNGSCSTTPY